MADPTRDGDEEWMRMNTTQSHGLGLTDPIKNIEASPNNLLLHYWLNFSRINGCCCLHFSR